jgi:hypothetical protein
MIEQWKEDWRRHTLRSLHCTYRAGSGFPVGTPTCSVESFLYIYETAVHLKFNSHTLSALSYCIRMYHSILLQLWDRVIQAVDSKYPVLSN